MLTREDRGTLTATMPLRGDGLAAAADAVGSVVENEISAMEFVNGRPAAPEAFPALTATPRLSFHTAAPAAEPALAHIAFPCAPSLTALRSNPAG